MIVKFFEDDITGIKHDEKGGSIYLAGPTRWNVHLKSWRKEAVNILESLGYEGLVFCPEYEKDNGKDDSWLELYRKREMAKKRLIDLIEKNAKEKGNCSLFFCR